MAGGGREWRSMAETKRSLHHVGTIKQINPSALPSALEFDQSGKSGFNMLISIRANNKHEHRKIETS